MAKRISAAKGGMRILVHAHHIVMKTVPKNWGKVAKSYVKGAQKLLQHYHIKMLASKGALRSAGKAGETLFNLCWAINNWKGIHSEAYAKAVFKRLWKAAAEGKTFAQKQANVKRALLKMGKKMSKGKTFW